MARPVRVSTDLVRLRAEEIRASGKFRGKRVHFGSRPPADAIAFTKAVALRLGCSVSLVKRALGGRSRSGPRRSISERAHSLARELPVDHLRQALEEIISQVARDTSPAAESALALFANESLPMSERVAPLLSYVKTPVIRKVSQTDRAEALLWKAPVQRASTQRVVTHAPEKIVRDYLLEALDASLSTPNTLGVQAKEWAQLLERELRAQ